MTAIDRAIEIYSQTRGENSLAVIECLEEKLLTLIYAGDITRDEAVSVAARRLHAVRNSKDDLGDMWIASVWREYAHQLLVSNRFEEAEVELRAAGEFARERLGKGIESTRCPMILAQVRYLKGDHLEALALAQQSYDEALAADPRHNELSWKRSVLACCLVADGQMERAESFINADDIRSFVLTWGQGCAATTHMITDAAARLRTSGRESSARILDDAHAAIDRRPRTLDAPVPFQDFIRESPPVPGKVPGDKE
jgi:hypothetical protein